MEYGRVILVHFGELWLRGKNRSFYINKLVENIELQLSGVSYKLSKKYDHLEISTSQEDENRILDRLSKVFGISNCELAYVTKPDLSSISELAIWLAKSKSAKSVKIMAHRSFKNLGFSSNDIIREVSKYAKEQGIGTSLHAFDLALYINVSKDSAFVFSDRRKGLGGLPVGSEGKCIVLLSGGIDSPVAAWFAMKRGLEPIYAHVYSGASSSYAMQGKISSIRNVLDQYFKSSKMYLVPSYLFEAAATSAKAGRLSLVVLKRFLLGIADSIARKEGTSAIVTGESLGQVASQTLENLQAESFGIRSLILRPLIGFDKEEIINIAKKIGTYELSILPYKDVCTINSKNPKTKASKKEVAELAKKMKIGAVIRASLSKSTIA